MIEAKFGCPNFEIYNLRLIHLYFEFLKKGCTQYHGVIQELWNIIYQCHKQGELKGDCVSVSHH